MNVHRVVCVVCRGVHAYVCVRACQCLRESEERKTDWHMDKETVKKKDKGDCTEREREDSYTAVQNADA